MEVGLQRGQDRNINMILYQQDMNINMILILRTLTGVRTLVLLQVPSVLPAVTQTTSPARNPGCASIPSCCAMAIPSASLERTRPSPPVWIFGSTTKSCLALQPWSVPADSILAVQYWPHLAMESLSASTSKMSCRVRIKHCPTTSWPELLF